MDVNTYFCFFFQFTDFRSFVGHNHPPNQSKKLIEFRKNLHEKSKGHQNPAMLLANELYHVSDEVKANVGKISSLQRDIRRQRQKLNPKGPLNVEDLTIPEEWKSTGGKESQEFLIHDSGKDHDRIVIFASETGLQNLSAAKEWFMDGTFKLSSSSFEQLYVVHAINNNVTFACVYAFMNRKNKTMYRTLFSVLRKKTASLNLTVHLKYVMLDFEDATMRSLQEEFGPTVQVKGCYFHLCQSTWRQIQTLGLTRAYRENNEIKQYCGMLDALAFLPTEDVTSGMAFLWENAPFDLVDLLVYFDRTYVSGQQGNPPRPPLFPPQVWNVRDAVIAGTHKTNNISEAWNRRLQHLVSSCNPTFWEVVKSLRIDEAFQRTKSLLQPGSAQEERKRMTEENLRRFLRTKCVEYRREAIPEFLVAIGKTIRFGM